jgi:hypothetical protein
LKTFIEGRNEAMKKKRNKGGLTKSRRKEGFGINSSKDEAQTALFKDPVRTALSTLFISVIKTNQFML